jgi:hypothetical protein
MEIRTAGGQARYRFSWGRSPKFPSGIRLIPVEKHKIRMFLRRAPTDELHVMRGMRVALNKELRRAFKTNQGAQHDVSPAASAR